MILRKVVSDSDNPYFKSSTKDIDCQMRSVRAAAGDNGIKNV